METNHPFKHDLCPILIFWISIINYVRLFHYVHIHFGFFFPLYLFTLPFCTSICIFLLTYFQLINCSVNLIFWILNFKYCKFFISRISFFKYILLLWWKFRNLHQFLLLLFFILERINQRCLEVHVTELWCLDHLCLFLSSIYSLGFGHKALCLYIPAIFVEFQSSYISNYRSFKWCSFLSEKIYHFLW